MIQELITITRAKILVSSRDQYFPETESRTVYIVGDETAVLLAQSLLWEMIGHQTNENNSEKEQPAGWKPSVARRNPGQFDDLEVEGEITIPAICAGAIIGAGGSTLRSIAEECDIEVVLNDKKAASTSQERIVSMVGSTAGCMKCTALILSALKKEETNEYVIKGTVYE